jgi:predicted ATPase
VAGDLLQDAERKQTLGEAERTYEALVETYADFGHSLVPLPRVPVAERVRFVVDQIAPPPGGS